jgi:3-phenylpropionate/trans-cinnamate dioxygenase ferredoxin reductase component
MRSFDVAIVGTGHAGAQAAIALRQAGFAGSIGLVGRETEPPYERPPLSKDYLKGEKGFDRLLIRPEAFWAERGIALVPGFAVEQVDAAARQLNGGEIGYGRLIWAAGGTPHRLACRGGDLAGVHVLRARADADALMGELAAVRRVAVIGGGYVGLEAAAALRALGKEVVLIEAADRLLGRVAALPISDFFARRHRAEGVDIRLSARVEALEGEGRVAGVRLAGGGSIACDLAVVGIGIAANAAPLIAAGAEGGDGVHVDAACRTSLPDIYAIGDCAAHESRWAGGRRVRVESVGNAHDMAAVAARSILGEAARHEAVPWFWSNQYEVKLQSAGLMHGHDATVLRGDPESGSFSLLYLRGGRVAAIDCVNQVRDYAQGRKLIEAGVAADPVLLADPARPLKELIA